jgi:hypothetical protein
MKLTYLFIFYLLFLHSLSARVFDPHAMPHSYGVWLDGEALYWQSNMGSLGYGIESSSTSIIKHGHVKHLDFDWNWGFRLGLGYKLPHDKWDLLATYTHLFGNAHGHAGGSGDVVFPSWATNFGFSAPLYADKAKTHWHLNLNMADLELGRNCLASHCLSMRPFMGVRGLFIDHDFSVNYTGGSVAPGDVDRFRADSDFWGVGLRFGVDTLWGLGKGVGIYGNGSASLLSGHFDVHEKEKPKHAPLRVNIENDVDNVVAAADLALGLQWDYLFSNDRFHLGLKFGWEFNLFFDQNQLFNFLSSENPGAMNFKNDDLTFQGVTLGLRFDF